MLLQDDEMIVIDHDNGLAMINTHRCETNTYYYILPNQCEHVFFLEVPGREGWSFVVSFNLRGRPVKYIFLEEYVHDQEEYN